MELKEKVVTAFASHFGGEGTLYASAGRINLIGEHTDYNGGFVFPGAIDKVILADIRPNGTDTVNVYSIDIDEEAHFGLKEEDAPTQRWARTSPAMFPLAQVFHHLQLLNHASHLLSMTFSTETPSTSLNLQRSVSQPSIITAV